MVSPRSVDSSPFNPHNLFRFSHSLVLALLGICICTVSSVQLCHWHRIHHPPLHSNHRAIPWPQALVLASANLWLCFKYLWTLLLRQFFFGDFKTVYLTLVFKYINIFHICEIVSGSLGMLKFVNQKFSFYKMVFIDRTVICPLDSLTSLDGF